MIPQEITDRTHDHPLVSILLLLFGWTVNTIAELSGEVIYLWAFRAVSFLSVSIILIINWRKAREEFFLIFKFRNDKKNK